MSETKQNKTVNINDSVRKYLFDIKIHKKINYENPKKVACNAFMH